MKISSISALAVLALRVAAAPTLATESELANPPEVVEELNNLITRIKKSQLEALEARNEELTKRGVKPTCHIGNLAIRRE
jgi:hypothetical protein